MQRGDRAPDFELDDQFGNPTRLWNLIGTGPVVLFFFPAAMTFGCTRESCHFQDLREPLAAHGGQPVGVSRDSPDRLALFAKTYSLDFRLLSDRDGEVARRYGVLRRLASLPLRRTTFVIGADLVILEVIATELGFRQHADRALGALAGGPKGKLQSGLT
ncbi:MAG: peroxiredoxin [Acidimicrobiales bacterium]